ncbi:hypothetical protein BAU15_11010 [Enterococcus sp. JM4C]|uniref:hypothetical protein n=1 Tax=Candidatus Enterococcus huntleyi TaxID=1857217 RepID=UPI00137AB263|nr:hypothetical protein [Enterococcus sp. JM4C]KAF1298647.1 hypothetical protein BAU15_11010 [Enterococcus sp. JM4C]
MKKFVKLGIVLTILSSSFSPIFVQATEQVTNTYTAAEQNATIEEAMTTEESSEESVESTVATTTVPEQQTTESSLVESSTETATTETSSETTITSEPETEATTQTSSEQPEEEKPSKVKTVAIVGAEGKPVKTDIYVTITAKNFDLWKDFKWNPVDKKEQYFQKTFHVKESYSHENGKKYLALYNKKGTLIGYIEEAMTTKGTSQAGAPITISEYVTVTNRNHVVWGHLYNKKNGRSDKLFNKTYLAKEVYTHFDGIKYYSLYDKKGKWYGYLNSVAVTTATSAAGAPIKNNEYVTVTNGNHVVWSNLYDGRKGRSNTLLNKTYLAKEYYTHYDGIKYYSLYDKNGKWYGYLNSVAVTVGKGAYGAPIKSNEYVTVTNRNHVVWSSLYNGKKGRSSALLNKTYLAKEYYTHYDGIKYYSLYDKKGKWHGYLNSVAVTVGKGAYGAPIKTTEYVTVTNGNHVVWSSMYDKRKGRSSALLNKTYLAKEYYTHYDGIKYYSLYDKKGKWYGYLNSVAVKKGNGQAGVLIPTSKYVTVTNPNHVVWNNFYNSRKGTSRSLYNKVYHVRGYYTHYDGVTYYSMYDQKGRWVGYLNKVAVREKQAAAAYLGISRANVVNQLSRNQNNGYYLGTPYKGLGAGGYSNAERFMVPRGAPNRYGVGMNCTGFVAHAIKHSGANMNKITGVANSYGGLANAYNWRDALLKNTMHYSFNSVSDLLKSGKAKKGDILYFEADFSKPNPDCHIAFFWGNKPSENKTWHQVGRGNIISNIFSGTPYSKVYLIPLD